MEQDVFEQKLDEEIVKLQQCQVSHNLNSCMPCEEFIDCVQRKAYVKAVYESMNKGQEGSFDFN